MQDDELEKAYQWLQRQAEECFGRLRDEIDYLCAVIRREHSRRSYATEVENRLRAWLG